VLDEHIYFMMISSFSDQDTGCAAVESSFYSRQGRRFLCCPERPDQLWNTSSHLFNGY